MKTKKEAGLSPDVLAFLAKNPRASVHVERYVRRLMDRTAAAAGIHDSWRGCSVRKASAAINSLFLGPSNCRSKIHNHLTSLSWRLPAGATLGHAYDAQVLFDGQRSKGFGRVATLALEKVLSEPCPDAVNDLPEPEPPRSYQDLMADLQRSQGAFVGGFRC